MREYLLSGGTVITVDRYRRIIDDGAVLVRDGRIAAVGGRHELVAAAGDCTEIVDCRGRLVVPGLIDTHGHAGHSLMKTLGCDSPTWWMHTVTPAYFHHTDEEFWSADGELAALERARAGVTTGVSIIGSRPRSDHASFALAHARATRKVGVRDILCTGPAGLPEPQLFSAPTGGGTWQRRSVRFDEMLATAASVIDTVHRWHDTRSRAFLTPFTIVVSVDPSHPSPPDVATALTEIDRYQARRVRAVARDLGVRIHSDAFGGMVSMAAQDADGALLGPDVHLQHCTGMSPEEVMILADTGTHVSHAPGGAAPIPMMLAAGVPVAISTDGCAPRRPFDLLLSARTAQQALQIRYDDPYLLPPGRLLEMITVDAARVLGLADEIGSLEVGKRADVITIDTRAAHLTPMWMPVHRLIYQATGGDVESVMVDGEFIIRDRAITTVDESAVLHGASEQARAVIERAGLHHHLTDPGWGMNRRSFASPIDVPQEASLP